MKPITPEPRFIVQLAPPGSGGVADYLRLLQTAWAALGVPSAALQLAQAEAARRPLATRLRELAGDRPLTLAVHFSGYGYASRGLCWWLQRELAAARAALGSRLRLVTMFHELFAAGPPWRSAFWTRTLQARIAAGVARLSDVVWTNSTHHAAWLAPRIEAGSELHVAPVFSTVGEGTPGPLPPAQREASLVVFGGPSTRQRALDGLAGRGPALRALGLSRIVEAGAGRPCRLPRGLAGMLPPVQFAGRLELPQLQALLASSRYGLLEYPAQHLGKSTVFAAYASFGCAAINACSSAQHADGLTPGQHYLVLEQLAQPPAAGSLADTVAAAAAWYHQHRLAVQAADWLRLAQR